MAISEKDREGGEIEKFRKAISTEVARLKEIGVYDEFLKKATLGNYDMYDVNDWTLKNGNWTRTMTSADWAKAATSTSEEPEKIERVFSGKPSEVRVYTRFRPLVGSEVTRNDPEIVRSCAEAEDKSFTLSMETSEKERKKRQRIRPGKKPKEEAEPSEPKMKQWKGHGFAGIFEGGDNNEAVFAGSIKKQMEVLLTGGTLSCFAYGHTESGKTHTQLGYGDEKGMYYLTAQEMIKDIQELNEKAGCDAKIEVRFFELHNKKAYDLINNRAECHVREGEGGKVLLRAETKKGEDGRVRVTPLKSVTCNTADELQEAVKAGSALRQVGSSTLHDQSSRSHAFIELDVVNEKILEARRNVIDVESEMTFFGHHSTCIWLDSAAKLFGGDNFQKQDDGSYLITASAEKADIPALCKSIREGQAATCYHTHLFEEAKRKSKQVVEEQRKLSLMFGAKALFVDLAGSEHGSDKAKKKQSREAEREGREINMSLMALNEVIRKQMIGATRIPFRDSRLTMIMREYLTSEQCTTLMIANVSPSKEHSAKTLSTLRYAQLVAKNDEKVMEGKTDKVVG